MAIALDQFIRRVSESSVMSQADITALLATLPPEKQPADGEACAKLLVKEKKLTKYQAEQIYVGKGKSLVLGNYAILDKIGAGGMGQVFKARHKRMNRLVAIKLLPPELNKDEATIQRFHREVQAAAKLTHPNIVIAYDADEAPGGIHFLVMEFVAGKDLAHLVAKEHPLSVAKVVLYILQAAKGLAYAHENGVVHRDIKPANLLLDEKGSVKILDMGLARLNDAAAQANDGLTKSGDVMGTVDYMAPEQAFDTHNVDGRADIYSLGCTLYRLLTNSNLYDAESIVQKLMAHQSKPIPSLQKTRSEIPAELQTVFEKMVAKSVEDRYQNMSEVIDSLQAIYDSLTNSATLQPSKPDSKLKAFFRNLIGSSTKPGNDAPTSAVVTSEKPQVAVSNPALDATINLSNPAQVTDPVSDRSINVARSITPQPLLKKKPFGPWWRNRNVIIAAGAGGFLLMLLAIWVIIKDKDGKEVARIKVPEGGVAEIKEVVEEKPTSKNTESTDAVKPLTMDAPGETAKKERDRPIPAEALTFNGHRYLLVTEPLSWDDAKARAESLGGHLAVINNQAEHDWVKKTWPNEESPPKFYIGGSRPEGSGDWTWVTGEAIDLSAPYFSKLKNKIDKAAVLVSEGDKEWHLQFKSGIKHRYLVEWDTLGPANVSVDPQRALVLKILERGGGVGLKVPDESGQNLEVHSPDQIPPGPFVIYQAFFRDEKVKSLGDQLFTGLNFEPTMIVGVSSSTLTDNGLAQLTSAPKQLELEAPLLTDKGLAHLGKLNGIKSLALNKLANATGAGLARLPESTTHLSINFPITPTGLAAVCENAQLKSLGLFEVKLTPTLLQALAKAKVETIGLNSCDLNDELMQHFPPIESLVDLYILNTDVGLKGLLELKKQKNLKTLWIAGRTKLTQEDAQALPKSLPNVKIDIPSDTQFYAPSPAEGDKP